VRSSRKVLFDSGWLRVVELNGWFHSTEPANSKDNMAVAVLPYRKIRLPESKVCIGGDVGQPRQTNWSPKYTHEFLSRFELNPAHMTDLLHQCSVITGACETGDPLYHAKMELLEEGGYDIPEGRFKFLGVVFPAKSSSTRLHLYTVRIYQRDIQQEAKGDGGKNEKKEYSSWVGRKQMIACKDPYVHTIMLRGNL
jgi:hypothetical protein